MNTCSIAVAAGLARPAATPAAPTNAVKSNSAPPQQPTEAVRRHLRPRFAPATWKRTWWAAGLAVVGLLLAANLAATLIYRHRVPTVASYNSHVADLDRKLSSELAKQLRTAGFDFDAAIVSVESPACARALCLLKFLRREDHDSVTSVVGGALVRYAGNGFWAFTGTGKLAAFKFSVDASAEMRRLKEATPPEFPQAAMMAITPTQFQRATLSAFNREVEAIVPACQGARPQWLDLETGRCLTEPDSDYFADQPSAQLDWLRTNGLDLVATVYRDGDYCLYPRHMAVAPVDEALWEQATPEAIASHPALRLIPHPVRSSIAPARGQVATYIFRTEEGTFGMLRVLGLDPSLSRLTIHYKLAPVGAKAAS